jgi:23S rRNA pseudouridine2605 synthase
MRLSKYLAHAGIASRRAAEIVIGEGRVTVAGEVVRDPARDVDDSSRVVVDGRSLGGAERRVVYALNKPLGVLSTAQDTHGRQTVVGLIPDDARRLYPVGRLDADSTGLILLTNDGELAHRLTHPSFEVPKTYRVQLAAGPIAEQAVRRLREGVTLEDGPTAPAEVRRLGKDRLEITIHEGRNRQVRRMCDAVGHPVRVLQRVAFAELKLGKLALGDHRLLSRAEIERLRHSQR